MTAFIKKEWMEQIRTGKLYILGGLFLFFGILNPLIAKLTPWLYEQLADSMKESGIVIQAVSVTALDSWTQFYKNVPMALIAFVLVESGIFTKEYASGTLILALTKGLSRTKVVLSKALTLIAAWTGGYWLCFGVTYGYSAYYWDNSVVQNLLPAAVLWWIFGLWITALMVIFSTMAKNNSGVLLGVVAAFGLCMLLGMLPKAEKYLPTGLMSGDAMIRGTVSPSDYLLPMILALVMLPACVAGGAAIFRKKAL